MRFEFRIEPRDCWVGLFWDRRPELHLYVCPLPTVLFHWWWP